MRDSFLLIDSTPILLRLSLVIGDTEFFQHIVKFLKQITSKAIKFTIEQL